MLGKKKPGLPELRGWIESELNDTRTAHSSWVNSDNEIAAFHARRAGYLEAALEVLEWFEQDLKT